MNCYICGDPAIKRHGRSNQCEKHHRFLQMQKVASLDKKYVPSFYELENATPSDMACPECKKTMNWIDGNERSLGAVLQHYRNGQIGICCLSCNTRHGLMEGDSYKDLPVDHKLCRGCKTIKPISMFSKRNDGKKPYPLSKCKVCMKKAFDEWKTKNPEHYKLLNKKHNQIRKEKYGASI